MLATSYSRILVNGIPNPPIKHGQGLRQGDPLPPLLFVLAIDPLQHILDLVVQQGIISRLKGCLERLHISMYTDDAVLFVAPIKEEVLAIAHILELFGEAIGLHANLSKSMMASIICNQLNSDDILTRLPAK